MKKFTFIILLTLLWSFWTYVILVAEFYFAYCIEYYMLTNAVMYNLSRFGFVFMLIIALTFAPMNFHKYSGVSWAKSISLSIAGIVGFVFFFTFQPMIKVEGAKIPIFLSRYELDPSSFTIIFHGFTLIYAFVFMVAYPIYDNWNSEKKRNYIKGN